MKHGVINSGTTQKRWQCIALFLGLNVIHDENMKANIIIIY